MGMPSGKDGDAQWKRWGCPVEKMGMPSGKDGDAQWNLMEMFNGKYTVFRLQIGLFFAGAARSRM
jgi:hypothetical protein